MTPGTGEHLVRIGELARRAGIAAATLRVWERRYGIVAPRRTESGYRLYSRQDERRLKRMVELIAAGMAPAEAAAGALAESEAGSEPAADFSAAARGARGADGALRAELRDGLLAFDEAAAQRTMDAAVASYSLEGLLLNVVLPVMSEIGEMWHAGTATVAQEHFASGIVRARVLPLARGWGGGEGPLVLLACPPGEVHDLGLVAYGLLLRERGWRAAFFGADTPIEALAVAAGELSPAAIVLATISGDLAAGPEEVSRLARRAPVYVGGAGAARAAANGSGVELLPEDLVSAADQLAAVA